MKSKRTILSLLLVISGFNLLMAAGSMAASPSDESDVRSAVQRIFDQLKSGQYEALYDSLPSSSRARLSRDQLVKGLQRTSSLYQLQTSRAAISGARGRKLAHGDRRSSNHRSLPEKQSEFRAKVSDQATAHFHQTERQVG